MRLRSTLRLRQVLIRSLLRDYGAEQDTKSSLKINLNTLLNIVHKSSLPSLFTNHKYQLRKDGCPPIYIGGNGGICEQLRFVNNHKVADVCSTYFCVPTNVGFCTITGRIGMMYK